MERLRKENTVIYPELSYVIIGALFNVYNSLGHGLLEKTYQRAVATALRSRGLKFRGQVPYQISYQGVVVGQQHLDFLIEDKVILELKQGDRFRKVNFDQVNAYLKSTGHLLAILANFSKDGVLFRRMVNTPR